MRRLVQLGSRCLIFASRTRSAASIRNRPTIMEATTECGAEGWLRSSHPLRSVERRRVGVMGRNQGFPARDGRQGRRTAGIITARRRMWHWAHSEVRRRTRFLARSDGVRVRAYDGEAVLPTQYERNRGSDRRAESRTGLVGETTVSALRDFGVAAHPPYAF